MNNVRDLPVTKFGRRILVRHALVTKDGRTGALELARSLGCMETTIWKLLKTDFEDRWYMKSQWLDISARLCLLLKVDHSWLFDTIDYGDIEPLRFAVAKRNIWKF